MLFSIIYEDLTKTAVAVYYQIELLCLSRILFNKRLKKWPLAIMANVNEICP